MPASKLHRRAFDRWAEHKPEEFVSYPSFRAGWNAALEAQADLGQIRHSVSGAASRAMSALAAMASLTMATMVMVAAKNGVPYRNEALPFIILLGIFAVFLWRRADRKDKEQQDQFNEKWS